MLNIMMNGQGNLRHIAGSCLPSTRFSGGSGSIRFVLMLAICAWLAGITPAVAADELEAGRRIYLEGILPSGAPLTGVRLGQAEVSGAQAACANCHRRSGMGSVEGDIQIAPITGNFLFATRRDKQVVTMDPRIGKQFNQVHEPYTDELLVRAIRQGVNSSGRAMNVMMPHYKMDDSSLKSLLAYLKQLSQHWSPGVTEHNIHFATVITPDVDTERRKAFISMMRIIVNQKNGSTRTARQGNKRQHMVSAAEMVLGTERNWTLDVWELQGAPETWAEQLDEHYRAQPVFALVSGLGGDTWQPVHDFCERERVPCWFPNVDLPPLQPGDYSLYFSGGTALEAEVLARHLLDMNAEQRPQRVLQVYRYNDYAAKGAAQELASALTDTGIKVENRVLQDAVLGDPATQLRHALSGVEDDSAVMFWLRPGDITALSKVALAPGVPVYFSGELSGGEQGPYPAGWKAGAKLVYPYELPEKREANLAYFHAWLNMRKLPLVDETMQSSVFFALTFLTETTGDMLDNMYRDYLIERAENMLSLREGSRAEQEIRERMSLGRPGDLVRKHGEMTIAEGERIKLMPQAGSVAEKREGTTAYPRLSLALGQRFASKGGYIVRFANGNSNKLVAETEWIVP